MMETPFILLSLFLFSILLSHAARTPPAVLDIDGKPVQGGVKYFIIPVNQSQGGGLDLASTGKASCLKSVVQVSPKLAGHAVSFYPVNPKDVVRNGTDLNVQFSGLKKGCSESTIWQISNDPENVDVIQYVVSGGVKGNPGSTTARSWFMILKSRNGYKFNFCPFSLCDCNPVCQDVGISVKNQHRLLEVNLRLPTFEVNFKKA